MIDSEELLRHLQALGVLVDLKVAGNLVSGVKKRLGELVDGQGKSSLAAAQSTCNSLREQLRPGKLSWTADRLAQAAQQIRVALTSEEFEDNDTVAIALPNAVAAELMLVAHLCASQAETAPQELPAESDPADGSDVLADAGELDMVPEPADTTVGSGPPAAGDSRKLQDAAPAAPAAGDDAIDFTPSDGPDTGDKKDGTD